MTIETVGPGGVGNSYGVRSTTSPSQINSTSPKDVYNEFAASPSANYALDSSGNVTGLVGPGGVVSALPSSIAGTVGLVAIGDSMTASIAGNNTVTSAARTNNVVTLGVTGHVTGNGELSNIYNMLDTSYNANGVVMTKVDANTLTYPSVGADGSTASLSATKPMIQQRLNFMNDNSWLFWLQGKSKGAFNLLFSGGRNGHNSTDMLARYTAEAVTANTSAQMITLFTGYNDFVIAGSTADTVYANMIAMVKQSAGKLVVVVSAIPLSSSNGSVTLAMRKELMRYNRMMRLYCNSTVNVRFADAFKYLVNSTSTTGDIATGMLLADAIHPSPKGAERIAQAIWDVVQSNVSQPSRLVASALDTITNDTSSKNLAGTLTFTNTGGALAGSPITTGVAAAGVGLTNASSGAGASVGSCPARSDGFGYDQTVVFSPAVVGDTITISSQGFLTTGVTAGDDVQMLAELTLTGMAVGANSFLRSIEISNGFNNTSSSGWTAKPQGVSGADYPNSDMTLTIVSPKFRLPVAVSGVSFSFIFKSAVTSGSLTIALGRISIEKLN